MGLKYLTHDLEKLWAIDLEGDPIPSTKLYLMCGINAKTFETVALRTYADMKEWIDDRLAEGCSFVAHNGIGYDFPTANRILGTKIGVNSVIDTNIMSQLYNPSFKVPPGSKAGPHSLSSWGIRIGIPKLEFDDFTSGWSEEMEVYCHQDALICLKAYLMLAPRMVKKGFSETGLQIEHRAWFYIQKQKRYGFYFNIEEAHHLYNKLREMEKEIGERVHEHWPPEYRVVFTGQQAYKKDGGDHANFARHKQQFPEVKVHPDTHSEWKRRYDCYDYVYFDIGSPVQRRTKLLDLGWKPREWTDSGLERLKNDKSPFSEEEAYKYAKPTEKGQLVPSLQEFVEETGSEQVKLLANWMEINSRANMINTWIEAYDESTHCIHGSLFLANTLRYKHSGPNTANIPAIRLVKRNKGTDTEFEEPLFGVEGAFTYEARNLWTVRGDDRVLIGVDAKGIQLRVLANYLNNPEFTEALLGGDPHSYNQEIGGFATRAIAKTFIYAFLLGAGDEKVGTIIGGSTRDGRAVKKRFIENFPGLDRVLSDLGKQVERTGGIVLCDGTPIAVGMPHARLGYLLQGDESRIMKKAMDLAFQQVFRRKLDIIKVGDIHDEWQNDALKLHSEEFAYDICPTAFKSAGEFFNYNIPIDCDAKIGRTWAETH